MSMPSHLSASQVDMYYTCGEAYRLRYIEGIKIPPGITMVQGGGVHKGVEITETHRINTEEKPPLDVTLDATRDGYVAKVKREGVMLLPEEKPAAKMILNQGLNTSLEMAKLYYDDLSLDWEPSAVEMRLEGMVPGLDYPLVGYLDILADDGTELWDLKVTGKTWNQQQADTNTGLTVYKYLLDPQPIDLCIGNLVNKKEPAKKILKTRRTEEDLQIFVQRANYMLAMVRAGMFPPAQIGSWKCNPRYCGYFFRCPYVPRHRKDTYTPLKKEI